MTTRSLLGACLSLPLLGLAAPAMAACPFAHAAPAQASAVEVTPSALEHQAAQMIANANAMFRHMAAEMNAMGAQMAAFMPAPMPIPGPFAIPAFAPVLPFAIAPGSGTVISIATSGNGVCSETITYSYPARGGQPVVHVAQRGDACGAIHLNAPGTVQVRQPMAPRATPRTVSPLSSPRLVEAEYVPHR